MAMNEAVSPFNHSHMHRCIPIYIPNRMFYLGDQTVSSIGMVELIFKIPRLVWPILITLEIVPENI